MRHLLVLSLLLTSLFPGAGLAQAPGDDPVAEQLFAPELIMKHQRDLALTDAQGETIKKSILAAQLKFFETQWDMQREQSTLVKLLSARPVDEAAVLAQIDRVLNLEREIKRAQMSLLIKIKNALSDQQIARLMELRKQR
ncbi:MAG TPA: periplasmic heavy metal sensor [Vicinamibacterales bacterium]|nr:periplasmic heavy metal sensor [Vicinamibacterales bacterium]